MKKMMKARTMQIIYAIFIVTIIGLVVKGNWQQALFLIGSLLLCYFPRPVLRWLHIKVPRSAEIVYSIFIFSTQYLGSFLGFYTIFPWWDIALHLSSGILLVYSSYVLVLIIDRKNSLYERGQIKLILLIGLTVAIAGAALWEVFEFSADQLLGTNTQLGSLRDTMHDIICGIIGGSLQTVYIAIRERMNKNNSMDSFFRCNQEDE